jgi:hypothetical protein
VKIYLMILTAGMLSLAACKEPPTVGQSRLTNQQLIGTFQGVKTLAPQLISQCDRKIRDYYIASYQKPYSWRKVITQTPMDETNLYIHNSHPSISRNVGFDVSRMVAFAARYQGVNAANLPDNNDFICIYEHTASKALVFKAAYSENQFESAWGIDVVPPAQWGGSIR